MKVQTKKYNFKNKNLSLGMILYKLDPIASVNLDYQNMDQYCVFENINFEDLIEEIEKDLSKKYLISNLYTNRKYHYLTNKGNTTVKIIHLHLPYNLGMKLKNKYIKRINNASN